MAFDYAWILGGKLVHRTGHHYYEGGELHKAVTKSLHCRRAFLAFMWKILEHLSRDDAHMITFSGNRTRILGVTLEVVSQYFSPEARKGVSRLKKQEQKRASLQKKCGVPTKT